MAKASIEWRIAFNRMAGRNNGEGQQLSSPCNYVTISGLAQRACPRISCTFNSYWVRMDDWFSEEPIFMKRFFFRATTLRQSMVLFWLASAIFQSRLEYQVLAQYLLWTAGWTCIAGHTFVKAIQVHLINRTWMPVCWGTHVLKMLWATDPKTKHDCCYTVTTLVFSPCSSNHCFHGNGSLNGPSQRALQQDRPRSRMHHALS